MQNQSNILKCIDRPLRRTALMPFCSNEVTSCKRSYGCLMFMHTSLQPREAYIKLPDIFAFLHAIFKWNHKSHIWRSRRAPRIFCLSPASQYGNICGNVRREMIKYAREKEANFQTTFYFFEIKCCFYNSYFVFQSGVHSHSHSHSHLGTDKFRMRSCITISKFSVTYQRS